MATEEYLTFNQTVKKLGISEDELLNLVSGNQLRAFRIDRETKFRLEDVDGLRAQEGEAPLEAEESAVLDFNDLPEDIVLMEEETPSEETLSIAPDEGELLSLDGGEDSAFELVPAEEVALPEDELAIVEEEPAFDFGDDSLEIVESTSEGGREQEETIVTDSSAVAGLDELTMEDEDFDFSTQEVTIHEDAISEDEVLDEQTAVDETIPLEEEEEVEQAAHKARSQRSQRSQRGRASGGSTAVSGRSRSMSSLDGSAGKGAGGLIWTGILAIMVLAMIYPSLLLGTLLVYGYTTGRETIAPGSQTWDGVPENISEIWVPKAFSWVLGDDVRNYFGSATYEVAGVTLDKAISFSDRESMNMLKIDTVAPAPISDGEQGSAGESSTPAADEADAASETVAPTTE